MDQGPVTAYFEMLRDEIPESFLQKLRQSQTFIYQEAYGRSFLDVFAEPEARDLCGHMRRALFETQLMKIAGECGLACEVHTNKKRSEFHRVVKVGRLFLTCSAVRTPQQRPRTAQFRKQAALNPLNAFPAFDFITELKDEDLDEIYVVIIHGPDPRALNNPGFLCVGVPDRRWKRWLDLTPVDDLLQAQALRRLTAGQEQITDRAVPRTKVPKKKEDHGK